MSEIVESILMRNLESATQDFGTLGQLHQFWIPLTGCGRVDLLKLSGADVKAAEHIYITSFDIFQNSDLMTNPDILEIMSYGELLLNGDVWALSEESRCLFDARITRTGQRGIFLIVSGLTETDKVHIDLLHITYSKN
jgi:hypothetical protein